MHTRTYILCATCLQPTEHPWAYLKPTIQLQEKAESTKGSVFREKNAQPCAGMQ